MTKPIVPLLLGLTLLLSSWAGPVQASPPHATTAPQRTASPEALPDIPGVASSDWWTAVQEDIRQSEYHVTWQTVGTNGPSAAPGAGAYQAPNRAQNLRTTFTSEGIRVVPRVFDGETPPWEWRLSLHGDDAADGLIVQDNRVEYDYGSAGQPTAAWVVNDAQGLETALVLQPPLSNLHPPTSTLHPPPSTLQLPFSTNLTPRLTADGSAVEFTTADGTVVLRYGPFSATDGSGRAFPVRLQLFAQDAGCRMQDAIRDQRSAIRHPRSAIRLALQPPPSNLQHPVTLTARLTSPAAAPDGLPAIPNSTVESDQGDAEFGWSVGTAGDVNGDGYADVIVGAHHYDHGQENEGRAFVYHGSAAGLSATASWSAEGDQAYACFGTSVNTAGDVNGDGYADVIVGADYYDHGQADEGRAFVYHGSAAGLSATANWTAESNQAYARFGHSVSTAGDVNGDGYADVIVGAWGYDNGQADEGRAFVYHGSAAGLSNTANWTAESNQSDTAFGWSVGTAGDVNGDGYADVIVGAEAYTNGQMREGCAFVYHGSAAGLSATANWTAESNQTYAEFGWSVGTAGDVNGDGYADVIVGAAHYNWDPVGRGQAFVYHGSAAGLSATANWSAESDQVNAYFGWSVGTAGDVNGDGYADVIVGAWNYRNTSSAECGRAFVYHGSVAGLSTTANWIAESNHPNDEFGTSVGTAGDVNGDGYSDVIVGAARYDNDQVNEGRAFVYHGAPDGLAAAPAWGAEGDQTYANFGWSVSTAGDVNGDGYADVIVGAPGYDNGQTDEGRAYFYYGAADGLSATPAWIAEGDQDGASFGRSVGTAGDVNGDGYADVIVGAPGYDNGQMNEGRAFVYYGSVGGLASTPAWFAEGEQAGANFGYSVSTAGDVNGDGYADVIVSAPNYDDGQADEGRAFVYHGAADGLQPDPAWTAESDNAAAYFGISVDTAGDVNGDGYADVIVGAPGYDNGQADEGGAFVYHGSAAGLAVSPAWTTECDQVNAWLGMSVGTAGDVNGDGYADVIVGAMLYDNGQTDEGRVFVYHGAASGLPNVPAWSAESDQTDAYFGISVGGAGDVNGDGYADVIVGAHYYTGSQIFEGRAFVYHGAASGLSITPDWIVQGDHASEHLGFSVATAGDVNGDGYADVIVGAPCYYHGQVDEGAAFVYYGNGGDGLDLRPQSRRADDSAPIAPLGMSDSRTQFRLSVLGRTPFGRGLVRLQWEVKPLGTPFDGTGLQQSAAWQDTATAGAALNELVAGLAPDTPYHWRARLLYHPATTPFQLHGRWFTQPWNGWNETDLRTPPLPTRFFVDRDAPGPLHDGLSWTTAFTEVQSALAVVLPGNEIWVAEGVYTPDFVPGGGYSGAPTATFALPAGVALYGGFAGWESELGQRDWTVNVTVLSGDLERNDLTDPHGVVTDTAHITGTNAYHVVTSEGVTETAVLDGFVVTAGQTRAGWGGGFEYPYSHGGGMRNDASSPTVAHVVFSGNFAGWGGGMHNRDSNPTLTDVTFSNNLCSWGGAWGYGAGMYNWSSHPTLTDVTFIGNSVAQDGGAMNNNGSSPLLTNVVFEGNSAHGGAGMLNNNGSSPTLINAVFRDNAADGGGGMYNVGSHPTLVNVVFSGNTSAYTYTYAAAAMVNSYGSAPLLVNVTFGNNHAASGNDGIVNSDYSAPTLVNCVLWNNGSEIYNDDTSSAIVTFSDVEGGWAGAGNLDADPRFVDAASNDLRLGFGSPAIDAGDGAACPTHDLDGIARPVGFGCDMGAYEMHAFAAGVGKSASDLAPLPGQVVTFTVVVTNSGPGFGGGLISDTLPAGLQFIGPITLDPPEAGSVGSAPPTLAHSLVISANRQVTVTFPVSVALGLVAGTPITNSAAFTAPLLPETAAGVVALVVANAAPAAADDAFAVLEDSTSALDVLANDDDANGDALSISAVGAPDQGGTALSGGDVITYTPASDFAGTEVFTYTVSDGRGGWATAWVTVVVSNVNDAPVFTSAPVLTATQDAPYTYTVTADDPDLLHGDALTITALTLPAWLTLVDHGDGTATLAGTPANADVGDHPVLLRVTDSGGLSDTQAFTITVADVNDAPVFTSAPVLTATQDAPYTYAIAADDPDLLHGDALTITALTLPAWLTLVDHGDGTATLAGTPLSAHLGDHPVLLRVTDRAGLFATQAFTITVIRERNYVVYLPLVIRNGP